MRFHVTTVLFLSALAVFRVGGCSTSGAPSNHVASSATALSGNASSSVLLSSAALTKRLLNKGDLGEGYTRTPPRRATQDDVAVIGCPALARLGADAATGAGLDFFRKTRASFAYAGGGGSEVSEELYSGSATTLSKGVVLVTPAIGCRGMVAGLPRSGASCSCV